MALGRAVRGQAPAKETFEALVEAGYDAGSALILASHVEVDLHQASDLLAQGCPPETAMRICLPSDSPETVTMPGCGDGSMPW